MTTFKNVLCDGAGVQASVRITLSRTGPPLRRIRLTIYRDDMGGADTHMRPTPREARQMAAALVKAANGAEGISP